MKKLLVFAAALIFFGFTSTSVFSQDASFNDIYPSYLTKLDTYRSKYANFTEDRDFYTKSPTLTLKEKVRGSTYGLLVARDDLIGTYLEALRTFINGLPNHSGDIVSTLNGERDWYMNHKTVYDLDKDSLETLFSKGEESKTEYENVTTPVVYESLSAISFSKYLDLKIRHENLYKNVKNKVETLGGTQRSLFDRWISDIDNQFTEISQLETKAGEIQKDFQDEKKRKDAKGIYDSLIKNLEKGKEAFNNLNSFIEEMTAALNNI